MFYTDEVLGSKRSTTPEGFMVIRDAVIGRTGTQVYHINELPDLEANADGWIAVDRPEAEVFAPRAMQSFEGKPLTLLHPADVVGPSNWAQLAVGHVAHVRRGTPPDDDTLVCDLIVTDQRGIDSIKQRGWKALSCGYDATYASLGPGRARQGAIVGNHVALLPEGEARCGPRCAVGDAAPARRTNLINSVNDIRVAALGRVLQQQRMQRSINSRVAEFWSQH